MYFHFIATGVSSRMTLQEKAAMKKEGNNGGGYSTPPGSMGRTYSSGSNGSQPSPSYSQQQPSFKSQGPPPPLPRKPSPSANYVTALYDYQAQADGDLNFFAGDRIQVLERKGPNEWWTGTCNGAQGVFPGNYVEDA